MPNFKYLFVMLGLGTGVAAAAAQSQAAQPAAEPPAAVDAPDVAEVDPPAEGPADRFIAAHQSIQQARLSTTYTAVYQRPDGVESTPSDYTLIFDRQAQRLRIDRPGFSVACDGQTLTLTSPTIPDRYLQVPLDGELTYARLIEIVPDLAEPIAPELILLLEADPAPWLSSGNSPSLVPLKPDKDDPQRRPRFSVDTSLGEMTLTAHQETGRVAEARIAVDAKHLVGSGITDAYYAYQIIWDQVNEPIDAEAFVLDTGEAEKVDSMRAFLAPPPPPPGSAPARGGGPTLLGLELPELELAPAAGGDAVALHQLAAEACADGGLLIVEFYANWTRPSVLDIPVLVEFQDWCEANDKPVTIVLVAVMQKRKQTEQWLDQLAEQTGTAIDLPILLDPAGEATQGLRLPGIPRTIILRDGKIIDVWGGNKPTFGEDLRGNVDEWLDAEAE
jgi:hypothetical protein